MKLIRLIIEFFYWFGRQNDYMFSWDKKYQYHKSGHYPRKYPHLWKTRFGFKTSWALAKIIKS